MTYVDPRSPFHEESLEPLFIPRSIPQPPPSVAVDDPADAVCVRINANWVRHVAGYLYGLTRYDAWDGTEAEVLFARQQAMNLLSLLRRGSDCEASMSCQDVLDCLDDVPAWQIINNPPSNITMSPAEIQQLSDEQHTERDTQFDGTPVSLLDDPVIDKSDKWANNPAWAEAITAFTIASFEAKLNQMRQIEGLSFIANLLLGLAVYLEFGYWIVKIGGWSFIPPSTYSTYNYDLLWDILQKPENLALTIQGLNACVNSTTDRKNITEFSFRNMTTRGTQWTANADMPIIRDWFRDEILNHPLMWEKNYMLLLSAIHTANHHEVTLGDPMWNGVNDNWIMNRGVNYSMQGVSALQGSVNQTQGFVFTTDSEYRRFDIAVTAPNEFNIGAFNLWEYNGNVSPARPTTLTVKLDGTTTHQSSKIFPNNSWYYFNLNAQAKSVRFKADYREYDPHYMPNPMFAQRLEMSGSGKPPTGYWTPD